MRHTLINLIYVSYKVSPTNLSEYMETHGHMSRLKLYGKNQACELTQHTKNSEGHSVHADLASELT